MLAAGCYDRQTRELAKSKKGPVNSVETLAASKDQKLTVKSISGDVVEQSVNLEQSLNSS